MEHWDSLKPGGYRFVYDDAQFRPGTDSFLLSSLPRLKPGMRVFDLGCGAGLLGLLLLQRQSGLFVTGIDIQPEAIRLAQMAAAENHLETSLSFHCEDLRNFRSVLPAGAADLVICNPPYYPPESGYVSDRASRRTARSETDCTLEDLCRAAAWLLRWDGSFCLVHKPERLTDVLTLMRQYNMEPKRLRFVCSRPDADPSLFLIEGRRGGKPGLTIEASLILQQPDASPTAEVNAIYFRQEESL